MAPKVETKQKLENAFRNTAFRTKLIDLTGKVLNDPTMMQHVNNLTVNLDLTDDFKAIKTHIATFGIDLLPLAEIPEPLPRPEGPANPSDDLKAGRVMMVNVQTEYSKAKQETIKNTTALNRAQKVVDRINTQQANTIPDIIIAAKAMVAAQKEELSAATQYEARLAEVRSTLQTAVAKMEEAEIAAEADVEAMGAAGGVMLNAETHAVRQQLVEATNSANVNLERLTTARAEEVMAAAAAKAKAGARGGRNRRTKKTNYYRKRQRTTRNKSRRNLN